MVMEVSDNLKNSTGNIGRFYFISSEILGLNEVVEANAKLEGLVTQLHLTGNRFNMALESLALVYANYKDDPSSSVYVFRCTSGDSAYILPLNDLMLTLAAVLCM